MIINKLRYLFAVCIVLFSLTAMQAQDGISDTELKAYEGKVKDIVGFLEYVLNTLGDKTTSARDKDVIINESYNKIFRDNKVQIEDDLDENREVITNKDVQAYLKDVNFFFKGVKFDFNIETLSHYTNDKGELFFKVTLARNLKGITVIGDSVNNTRKRFVEVNLNTQTRDLKIVSIYTHSLNPKEALKKWWGNLSYEWKTIFQQAQGLKGDATYADIKSITEIRSLDISGNGYITTIEPLSQLDELIVLNLSHTNINDLTPIRNLTSLEALNISHTDVTDLIPLKYASALQRLNISATPISDITIIQRFPKLIALDISYTTRDDISLISSLSGITELNISNTNVQSLSPLMGLLQLQTLKADSTLITTLEPLGNIPTLKSLSFNFTAVKNIQPLKNLPLLKHIYCDGTLITRAVANAFMAENPGRLIIFESDILKSWWTGLPEAWQQIFRDKIGVQAHMPDKEALAKLVEVDSLNLTANPTIATLEPLVKLKKLEKLIANSTGITDISPLQELEKLRYLDLSSTKVTDFSTLRSLGGLQVIKLNKTSLKNLDDLMSLARLITIAADETQISDIQVAKFLEKHPACLVVYKTTYLNAWWKGLSDPWRKTFSDHIALVEQPTAEQLHSLIETEELACSEASVTDLKPLTEFIRLKTLTCSGTGITAVGPLEHLTTLEKLSITRSPLTDIVALKQLQGLIVLDLSDTPVESMEAIQQLYKLTTVNCSGTQIKNLRDFSNLGELKKLDCSNTNVRRLDEISHLALKELKCFNTGISAKRIQDFKQDNPDCQVVHY